MIRPMRGNVKLPSASTVNLPERSGWSQTVIKRTSWDPMT